MMEYGMRQVPDGTESPPRLGIDLETRVSERPRSLDLFHLMAIVGVVTLGVHLPVLKCVAEFLDDRQYVIENPLVQDSGLTSARRFFTEILDPSTVQGYYQPVTMVSLMLDHALRGQSGDVYALHRTSLVLHVANTLLLTVLLYLLFGDPWAASIAGLLFGIHPVTAETIAWMSERKTLLAGFFSLGSLIFYVLHAQREQRRFYMFSVVTYALALLCKPTAVMLPMVMVLLDIWPLKRFQGVRRMIVGKTPLFAICVISSVVTYVSQSRTGGVLLPAEYGIWRIPLVLCHNITFYLEKIFWPVSLSPFYPYPEPFALLHPKVFPAVVGTTLLVILLVASLRWSRAVTVSVLMFFSMLLPTMQIVGFSEDVAANRFLYLPVWGLLILLASCCSWLFHRMENDRISFVRWPLIVIFLILGVAEGRCLRSYQARWRDTETLCRYILTLSPYEHKIHGILGAAFYYEGKAVEAIARFRLSTKLAPDPVRGAKAQFNLGRTLVQTGNTRLGLDSLRVLAHDCPDFHDASLYLAWILATHPDPNVVAPVEAMELIERVARDKGNPDVVVLDRLAAAYAAGGQFRPAVEAAKNAFDLAVSQGKGGLAEQIQRRLDIYRNHQRYCQDPTVAALTKAGP